MEELIQKFIDKKIEERGSVREGYAEALGYVQTWLKLMLENPSHKDMIITRIKTLTK